MPNKKVITTQARKMVYDVDCFIKKETDEVVDRLNLVKDSIAEATAALYNNLEVAIRSLHQIKNRSTSVADKFALITICNSLEYIRKEAADSRRINENEIQGIINNLKQTKKRTATATNISVATVRRISIKANSSDSMDAFNTPGTRRQRRKPITDLDTSDQDVIKNCIQNFLVTNKEFPTIDKLKKQLKEEINYQGSKTSLRRIIKNLGFRWIKTENK